MGPKFSLLQPPEVRQTSPATCWAAALESWLQVAKGRTYKSETDIIAAYKSLTINDPSRSLYNGMSIQGLMTIAGKSEINMGYVTHYNLGQAGSAFTADDIRARLANAGHVYLVYSVSGGSHANVIYGYDGTGSSMFPDFSVMDPGRGYHVKPFSSFSQASALFYGWPK